jgi:hypothetical protein
MGHHGMPSGDAGQAACGVASGHWRSLPSSALLQLLATRAQQPAVTSTYVPAGLPPGQHQGDHPRHPRGLDGQLAPAHSSKNPSQMRRTPLFTQPFEEPPDDPNAALLVDASNGFNELVRKGALWTVGHCLPPSSCCSPQIAAGTASLLHRTQRVRPPAHRHSLPWGAGMHRGADPHTAG